jgi:uncharacterized protein (DUF433 family)
MATVVGVVPEGMDQQDILKVYPDLEAENIHEALRFAAEAVLERELQLAS